MPRPCRHQYELETVGGVYLTGAYVCQLCSKRTSMTDAEFRRHATYPHMYQGPEDREEGHTTSSDTEADQQPADRANSCPS
jgi:hypothetical protein